MSEFKDKLLKDLRDLYESTIRDILNKFISYSKIDKIELIHNLESFTSELNPLYTEYFYKDIPICGMELVLLDEKKIIMLDNKGNTLLKLKATLFFDPEEENKENIPDKII
jgi:hypothetical protein